MEKENNIIFRLKSIFEIYPSVVSCLFDWFFFKMGKTRPRDIHFFSHVTQQIEFKFRYFVCSFKIFPLLHGVFLSQNTDALMWIPSVLIPHHEIVLPNLWAIFLLFLAQASLPKPPLRNILWLSGLAQDLTDSTYSFA